MIAHLDKMGLKELGVQEDNNEFVIYWVASNITLYLGDGYVTTDIKEAIKTNDIIFATQELDRIMNDNEFLEHLESMILI